MDGVSFGEEEGEKVCHRQALRVVVLQDCVNPRPARRGDFKQPHILPLNLGERLRLLPERGDGAVGIEPEGLRILERIGKAAAPEVEPVEVIGKGDLARRLGE